MRAGRCFGHAPTISRCVLIECEPQADVLLDSRCSGGCERHRRGVFFAVRLNEGEAPTQVSVKEDLKRKSHTPTPPFKAPKILTWGVFKAWGATGVFFHCADFSGSRQSSELDGLAASNSTLRRRRHCRTPRYLPHRWNKESRF